MAESPSYRERASSMITDYSKKIDDKLALSTKYEDTKTYATTKYEDTKAFAATKYEGSKVYVTEAVVDPVRAVVDPKIAYASETVASTYDYSYETVAAVVVTLKNALGSRSETEDAAVEEICVGETPLASPVAAI